MSRARAVFGDDSDILTAQSDVVQRAHSADRAGFIVECRGGHESSGFFREIAVQRHDPTNLAEYTRWMLIRPHDAALDETEWRAFLSAHDFGQLIAAGRGRDVPIVVPTHFVFDGERTVRLHLAKPNPVWEAIAENPAVVMAVIDAYTYIPTDWNANAGTPVEYGIPTSYYAAVQVICRASAIDDPDALAAILRTQLAHFQPQGGYARPEPGDTIYGKNLAAIRGLELAIVDVRAKFKFGGNKKPEHRVRIAERLADRDGPHDAQAREHLLRRHRRLPSIAE